MCLAGGLSIARPGEVRVFGLDSVKKRTERLVRRVDKIIKEGPASLADIFAIHLKSTAPKFTGHLQKNIYSVHERSGRARVETRTYLPYPATRRSHPYASAVDAGAKGYGPGPHASSAGYVGRAMLRFQKDIKNKLKEIER